MELADTSAWTNRHKSEPVEQEFNALLVAGDIATCPMVVMELLWTSRSAQDFQELRNDLAALPQVSIGEAVWARAVEVWHELALESRQRQVKIPDLLVASAAELAGIGVCHYDADFDAIAKITGQPVRAIAPLGRL